MRRDLASTATAEQENPACPSCGRDQTIYLGSFPELQEDAWGCLACGREFNLIPE
jgi:ribosomal protein L37AE/L43A